MEKAHFFASRARNQYESTKASALELTEEKIKTQQQDEIAFVGKLKSYPSML